MSARELIDKIINLDSNNLQLLLSQVLSNQRVMDEIEKIGYLKLTEKTFERIWNDPSQDIYQDYARNKEV